ncbi:hypothetical protein PC119_g18095 [Phytophthora cactorum]|uniref:Uncharacterized protein n=1 Tax=Phytophthora cactorum TaxID=29920 RepID=A0A8T1BID7_9STRA|nr:hypothetical protein PC112_g19907 [Phytophthora cactorum]KAG2881374.1 hypothetical protein PC114_g21587 [Phytophthora cactorum]KAG2891262.1 hypothetical protein PC115_g19253 [Phytophthora cactorum]KAG2902700.1 hypothetical protein PC117_g21414 [Phytophthora cactorum]KAG2995300.1 hypothetical protein PC119_g18095 [Phytophthora cactorum]
MAMVNEYIAHSLTLKEKGIAPPIHADYLCRLHNQLLDLQTIHHRLVNTDDLYSSAKQNKRRQYLCKVCSAFADKNTKSFETSYYCEDCGDIYDGRVPLCDSIRRKEERNKCTCYEVWRETWNDGKNIPPGLKKKIRFRKRK